MKRRPENPAKNELKKMLPVYIFTDALIAAVCLVLWLCGMEITWRCFVGIALGTLLSATNFLLIGHTAVNALLTKNPKKARFSANASYGARYIGISVIYAAAYLVGIIEILPAFLPMFVPRIYYVISAFSEKRKEEKASSDGQSV